MPTRKREDFYRQEAENLLRDVTTYHCAKREQLMRLYPGKEEKIERLLGYLAKQGRIFYRAETDTYYDHPKMQNDLEMLSALWVLADFGDKYEYHSTDAYPTKIVFFADGETYEIIVAPIEKIGLILHALKMRKDGDSGKKILIVEDISHIDEIDLEDAIFCTVDLESGEVQYYKKE